MTLLCNPKPDNPDKDELCTKLDQPFRILMPPISVNLICLIIAPPFKAQAKQNLINQFYALDH